MMKKIAFGFLIGAVVIGMGWFVLKPSGSAVSVTSSDDPGPDVATTTDAKAPSQDVDVSPSQHEAVTTKAVPAMAEFTYVSDQNWDEIRSDYASYDLDTLKSLAESGDGKAQLFYAINITEDNPSEASVWFEEAAINTAFAGIGRFAFDAEMLAANQWTDEQLSQTASGMATPDMIKAKMVEHFEKAALWAKYSQLRGDQTASQFDDMKGFFASWLPAERYDALSDHAQLFLEHIRQERIARGLGDFPAAAQ